MHKLSRSLLLGGLALGLAACGDDVSVTPPPEQPPVLGITLTPQTLNLSVGETGALTASVQVSSPTVATTVTYTSSNQAVATVSNAGVVTAVAPGQATITARSTADQNQAASAQVTVSASQGVNNIAISPASATISAGSTLQLAANIDAEPGVARTVTWTSSNQAVATVDANGVVTAVSQGAATIRATSTVDNTVFGEAAITVTPAAPGIISISANPATASLRVGGTASQGTTQIALNVQTQPGVTATLSAQSSDPAVATASINGNILTITSVGAGNAVITVTATAGNSTLTTAIPVTVTAIQAAQVSINAVNCGVNNTVFIPNPLGNACTPGLPVDVTNVNGQIDVVLNFTPGEQDVDSVAVIIDGVIAAVQRFATTPAAGLITLSVNTADYTIDDNAGVANTKYKNGPAVISATAYVNDGSNIATNTTAVTLTNPDGFAARYTAPTNRANDPNGFTWWGGPDNGAVAGTPGDGEITNIRVYPVIYTENRTITDVRIAYGFGPVYQDTQLPFDLTIGREQAGCVADSGYCNYAGYTTQPQPTFGNPNLENIAVVASIDNTNNPGPQAGDAGLTQWGLVGIPAAIPTPLRIDYAGPVIGNAPVITRTAPAVTGWINSSFTFSAAALNAVDIGVGTAANSTTQFFFVGCGTSTATVGQTVNGTLIAGPGNNIPECSTDFTGGDPAVTPGPFSVYAVVVDRLGNPSNSGTSLRFGVDNTAPRQRRSAGSVGGQGGPANMVVSGVVGPYFQIEALDDRSGFDVNPIAEVMSQANSVFPVGRCLDMPSFPVEVTRPAPVTPGATFVTNPDCLPVQFAAPIAVLADGYRVGPQRQPQGFGYYTYEAYFTDRAGNQALEATSNEASPLRNHMAIDPVLPAVTGLGIPALVTGATGGAFTVTGTDDVEVIGYSWGFSYPNVGVLRFPRLEPNARFDDVISTPVSFSKNPQEYFGTGPFVRGIEIVDGTSTVQAAGVSFPTAKPTAVQGTLFDVLGSEVGPFSSSAMTPILAGNVETGVSFQAFNTANPARAVTTWQILPLAAAGFAPQGLKAQAVSPSAASGEVNPPFARVDFYRQIGGEWHYLGSSLSPIISDNGVNRFWTYVAPAQFVNGPFSMTAQAQAVAGQGVIAVGVTAAGDGLSTLATALVP